MVYIMIDKISTKHIKQVQKVEVFRKQSSTIDRDKVSALWDTIKVDNCKTMLAITLIFWLHLVLSGPGLACFFGLGPAFFGPGPGEKSSQALGPYLGLLQAWLGLSQGFCHKKLCSILWSTQKIKTIKTSPSS